MTHSSVDVPSWARRGEHLAEAQSEVHRKSAGAELVADRWVPQSMAASVDHTQLVGHAVSSVMHTPCWYIGGEEMDIQKMWKRRSASDDRRNGEDQRDEGAGWDVGEEVHAVVPAFEASLEPRVVSETGVDVDEEAAHSAVRCGKVELQMARMGRSQTYLDKSCPHFLWRRSTLVASYMLALSLHLMRNSGCFPALRILSLGV